MRKVVITGAGGFLGSYLMEEFSKSDDVSGITREQCELINRDDVFTLMASLNPELIVHAAAMTDVEECQKNPADAMLNNQRATKNIVVAMPVNCKLIYISTDSVYSGPGPHEEGSNENPLNAYAVTKYMGEWEARNHLILRTSFYGASKNKDKFRTSICDTLIRQAKEGHVGLFNDSYFSPLHVKTLSKIINKISITPMSGRFNLGSQNGMSKLQFGLTLFRILNIQPRQVVPIISAEIPRTARPLDTRMDSSRFIRACVNHNISLPDMRDDMENLAGDIWLS